MKHLGIEMDIKNKPELDPGFIPLGKFNEAFLKTATEPFAFAVERNDKQIYVKSTRVHGDEAHADADRYYLDRLLKFELWHKGGFKVYVKGNDKLFQAIKSTYSPGGSRYFDAVFMGELYQNDFEVVKCNELPEAFEIKRSIGGHFDGCRIGFDAGGSDYKVAAVIDGKAVYSNETVWNPKINSDPDYHYNGVLTAFKDAMQHLPRVDAIGISSAGLIGNNRVLYAQLFQKVPKDLFNAKGRDVYIRAVKEIGEGIPFEVVNDGDVAALAGAISLNKKNLLGLALGTSFIGGFVDKNGYLSNWISELAFAPIDASPTAAMDDWTRDIGVGVQYFCQEAVIKLAPAVDISLEGYDTPAKKLKAVQTLLDEGHEGAAAIFRSIGVYLGHTAPFYYGHYGAEDILLLGRVVSGKGGDIILETAKTVLRDEYPDLPIELMLPDEHTRRMGQSVAAASLPESVKSET
ncbi:MAG: ROK family protein [Oscillospiraceae bacterium]|nr:ROK family protein [Oscillospiraceae bacterium]